MKVTRRGFELTVERQLVHSHESDGKRHMCRDCGSSVPMVTIETAAMIAQITLREMFRHVENRGVHFIEIPAGGVLVCRDSLRTRGVLR